jgi:hypothetical protein
MQAPMVLLVYYIATVMLSIASRCNDEEESGIPKKCRRSFLTAGSIVYTFQHHAEAQEFLLAVYKRSGHK